MSPVRMRITWAWVQSMGFISKATNTWMPHWTWIWVLSAYISISESQSGTGSMTSIHGLVQHWVLRLWIPVLYLRSVMGGSRARSRSRSKSTFRNLDLVSGTILTDPTQTQSIIIPSGDLHPTATHQLVSSKSDDRFSGPIRLVMRILTIRLVMIQVMWWVRWFQPDNFGSIHQVGLEEQMIITRKVVGIAIGNGDNEMIFF